MFEDNKNIWVWHLDLYSLISCNILLVKNILICSVRPEYAWWRALFSGAVLFLGLSGPLQALPENTQIGDVEPGSNLNFPIMTSITLSNMVVGRSEFNDVRKGPLGYDLNPEFASIGSMATGSGDDLPSETSLTRERVSAARLSSEESRAVAAGAPRITLATVTQTGADKPESNMSEAPMSGEDNGIAGKMLLRGEAVKSPYATITLAFLALLGLVSVARRDDIG